MRTCTHAYMCLSVCLSIYLSIYLSIHPSIHLSTYPYDLHAYISHAGQDLCFHQILGGDWKGVESALTSLTFIEDKCRMVGPYHLLTDYSAALDIYLHIYIYRCMYVYIHTHTHAYIHISISIYIYRYR